MEKNISRLSAEVRLIIADVGLLKASAEDKSIKFGGLGLRSLQEFHAWIDGNFKGLRYGLIMDPLLMLDRIFGSDDVKAESQFKILESRLKLNITTELKQLPSRHSTLSSRSFQRTRVGSWAAKAFVTTSPRKRISFSPLFPTISPMRLGTIQRLIGLNPWRQLA
jgi:hypothetical protein